MIRDEQKINDLYFDWMYNTVYKNGYSNRAVNCLLLRSLHDTQFTFSLPRDGNRAEDGIELRYRFGDECDIPDPVIAACLDIRPCSVLEMMVALALRCEEQIMTDPEIGNRVGQWFWDMIVSLGLGRLPRNFDSDYVYEVIQRFLNRDYDYDGHGGLFTIKNTDCDMRNMEIWYQMNHYLTANKF